MCYSFQDIIKSVLMIRCSACIVLRGVSQHLQWYALAYALGQYTRKVRATVENRLIKRIIIHLRFKLIVVQFYTYKNQFLGR